MQCPNCEKNVSENARFCDQCGYALEMPPQIVPEEEAALDLVEVDVQMPEVEEDVQMPHDDVSAVEDQTVIYDAPPPPAIEPMEDEPVDISVEEEVVQPEIIAPSEPESPVTVSPAAPTDELPSAGPRLVIEDGQAGGEMSYALVTDHAVIVGREDPIDGIYPDIDLTPHDVDTGVSRQHASLHEQGGQWFVQDLASTNYTIVNRRRLTPHEDFLLEDGDELRFGRVVALFKLS